MTGFNTQLSAECIIEFSNVIVQLSSNNICAIKSMILLEMKITPTKHARGDSGKEPKLHWWQNEKTLGETSLSRRASSPPARQTSSLFQLQQSQSVNGPLVPVVFPRWMSSDEVLTGDLSLGLIYVS